MDRGDCEVAVLGVVFFYSCVGRSVLGVFLHAVEFLVRDDASGRDGLPDMLRKGYAAVAAMKFPGASVFSGEEVLIPAFMLRKTACDGSHFGFRLIVGKRGPGTTDQQNDPCCEHC